MSRGSPMTSESMRATTRAGAAARASSPPLIAERCLRRALISSMVAPQASRRRVVSCFSARVRPSAGAGSRAEPPPEKRPRTSALGSKSASNSSWRRAPATPASSGTGCPASKISTRVNGSAWPYLVLMAPQSMRSPRIASAAAAMAAVALPAPTRRRLEMVSREKRSEPQRNSPPVTARAWWRQRPGSAAATPASKMARAWARRKAASN